MKQYRKYDKVGDDLYRRMTFGESIKRRTVEGEYDISRPTATRAIRRARRLARRDGYGVTVPMHGNGFTLRMVKSVAPMQGPLTFVNQGIDGLTALRDELAAFVMAHVDADTELDPVLAQHVEDVNRWADAAEINHREARRAVESLVAYVAEREGASTR